MLYVPLYRPKKLSTFVLRYEGDEDDDEGFERQLDTQNTASSTKRIDFENLITKLAQVEESNNENNEDFLKTENTETVKDDVPTSVSTSAHSSKKKLWNNSCFVDLSQNSQIDFEENEVKVDSQRIEEEKKKTRDTVLKELKARKNKSAAGEATGRAIQLKNGNDVVVYKLDKNTIAFDPMQFFTFGIFTNSPTPSSTPTKTNKRKRYVDTHTTNSVEKKVKHESPSEPSTPATDEPDPDYDITNVLLGFHGNPSSVQKKKKKQVYSIHQLDEVNEEPEGLKLTKDCLNDFTVQEMRMLLSQRGLDATGKKRDLRRRLEELLKK